MNTALNPIEFTENVVRDFLRYQATTFRFADPRMRDRLRELLSLDHARQTPLLRGPYVSLSRSFAAGASVQDLIDEGLLHAGMRDVAAFPSLYLHQEQALRSIQDRKTTLVSTGTGSGKTECFLYPVIDRMLRLRDSGEKKGIRAILVYPMNALAEDQLSRLREMLCGTDVTFGMYVGKTPNRKADVTGQRLGAGASRAQYRQVLERSRKEKRDTAVLPPEERASREEMRAEGGAPRILLTNVKQLELLLTRGSDVELFEGAELEYLVFDEAHTFSGANGAETAALVRRLVQLIGSRDRKVTFVGTSATLADSRGDDAPARRFAARFFGANEPDVNVVTETYERQLWSDRRAWPGKPGGDPALHLAEILTALGRDTQEADGSALAAAWSRFQPDEPALSAASWNDDLYLALSKNALCFHISKALEDPKSLADLATELTEAEHRECSEEELLTWLALGAAAQRDGRPILRPKVHVYLRGLDGGVVDFAVEGDDPAPRLWLSAQDQLDEEGDEGPHRLPVTVCTTCGQHYFVHAVEDLELGSKGPGGGEAFGQGAVWELLPEEEGGKRVVLFDRLAEHADADDDEESDDPRRCHRMYYCRWCAALHSHAGEVCGKCGRSARLVPLWAVEHMEQDASDGEGKVLSGYLSRCRSCAAMGRQRGSRYIEPARPVRATAVADVHVLGQSMLQRSARKRLLIFTDNRQEAAFQAGWMRDHARRFRFRALMAEAVTAGAASIGDLVAELTKRFDADDDLSRALIPEVWLVARKEAAGTEHRKKRTEYLRLQVLLELTQGKKQRLGLEPWGRLRIDYLGLDASLPTVQAWATRLDIDPERMVEGFGTLIDFYRRDRMLFDPETRAFSRKFPDGHQWIMDGFLPELPALPKAIKYKREGDDSERWLTQLWSDRGRTRLRAVAERFGIPKDESEAFVKGFWKLVTDETKLFVSVTLQGWKGGALPNASGGYQLDADRLTLSSHSGRWTCQSCRRTQVRPTPFDGCLQHNCKGTLVWEDEDPDDYDLSLLSQEFLLVRPREHSAQVPGPERERIEIAFKGDGDAVNTLVCTPTLELGVDIGGLDTVLLRNVPPLPANYWQRVGRAGRRHRLAVAATYARPMSHDRSYFAEPNRMLAGRVEPPRFNLANEEMVAKHVRATVITGLRQLARDPQLIETDRDQVQGVLERCFPDQISSFFFDDDGRALSAPSATQELAELIVRHRDHLVNIVGRTFAESWPKESQAVVSDARLESIVDGLESELRQILMRIHRRLRWHQEQIQSVNRRSEEFGGAPSEEEAAHRRRCERFVARLKGDSHRGWSDAEGQDETYTWSVLAAEGLLPGYGLESGSVRATAEVKTLTGAEAELVLTRAKAVALREYVPGNMIYANGQKYVARRFQIPPVEPIKMVVDTDAEAVRELRGATAEGLSSMSSMTVDAVPISDCTLIYSSRISDEEEYRFQMPVAVYGTELGRHGEGQAFAWGNRPALFRKAVHIRLVNVGAARQVEGSKPVLGYPLSLADGDSRSPFASSRELENFEEFKDKRGLKVQRVAFYADVVVDALSLADVENITSAWSVLEALRMAMSQVLDMEREDIDAQVLGEPGSELVTAVLYDPMPGGSGLLEQACDRWPEIVEVATKIVEDCPACCDHSCIDCLQDFRNAFRHKHLSREVAAKCLSEWGDQLSATHPIPAKQPQSAIPSEGSPTGRAERRLKALLDRAGMGGGDWQSTVHLGGEFKSTTPDVSFELEDPEEPAVLVYLDGLSEHIHGNARTHAKDVVIRSELRRRGYVVIEIPATHLEDEGDMAIHFYKIAKELMGKPDARRIRNDRGWFDDPR
jgi:ATP-dependent helicase YprA (DUF1998 family)